MKIYKEKLKPNQFYKAEDTFVPEQLKLVADILSSKDENEFTESEKNTISFVNTLVKLVETELDEITIETERQAIDEIDQKISELLGQRKIHSENIATYKFFNNLAIEDKARESQMLFQNSNTEMEAIIKESKNIQNRVIKSLQENNKHIKYILNPNN